MVHYPQFSATTMVPVRIYRFDQIWLVSSELRLLLDGMPLSFELQSSIGALFKNIKNS